MSKLSTESECAWLDWLDAKTDAAMSGDPLDRARAERLMDEFVTTFLPPEMRGLSLLVLAMRRGK